MLVFKKLSIRGLFRRGVARAADAQPPRADRAPHLTYADVRLSSLDLALQRQGSFDDWMRGDRR